MPNGLMLALDTGQMDIASTQCVFSLPYKQDMILNIENKNSFIPKQEISLYLVCDIKLQKAT
jgi:hypothetical protein